MTDYLVTSKSTKIAVDGEVTLMEALLAAATDEAVGDAAAGGADDTVRFDSSLSGFYLYLTAEIPLTSGSITISGDRNGDGGTDVIVGRLRHTIDGASAPEPGRHFSVEAGAALHLENLIIQGGEVSGEGGSIRTDGDLSVSNVRFEDNSAGDGGAIWAGQTASVSMQNTHFSANSASGSGSAIYVEDGGGLFGRGTSFFENTSGSGNVVDSGPSASGAGRIDLALHRALDQPLVGGSQDDRLQGGDQRDRFAEIHERTGAPLSNPNLFPPGKSDTLIGRAGNDYLDGSRGADVMIGGTGDDTYVVDDAGDQVIENASEGIDTVYSSISFTLDENVENLILLYGGEIGTGNDTDNRIEGLDRPDGFARSENTLIGGGGDDTLIGNRGNDTLDGGSGDDLLDGGSGRDVMIGGTGNDVYSVDDYSDQVIEDAGEGIDTVYASEPSHRLADNVETLILQNGFYATGNSGDNVLYGNDGDNVFRGGGGQDVFYGFGGDDYFEFDAKLTNGYFHQQVIVGFEGAGQEGGDELVLLNYGPDATFIQVATETYEVRDTNNATQARFWLHGADSVLTADDVTFIEVGPEPNYVSYFPVIGGDGQLRGPTLITPEPIVLVGGGGFIDPVSNNGEVITIGPNGKVFIIGPNGEAIEGSEHEVVLFNPAGDYRPINDFEVA